MGGTELVTLGALTYLAVDAREDARHEEQVAKSQMKSLMQQAPAKQVAPNVAARDTIRKKQRANMYGRQDTILTGTLGAPADVSGVKKVLLGS
mgnify:FL=1